MREEANNEELTLMTNLEYFKPDIRLVEAFLFESAVFEALQARVEAYVHANDTAAPNELGLSSTFRLGLQLAMAKAGVDQLLAPVAKPGTTRLKFTCVSQLGYPSESEPSLLPYSLARTSRATARYLSTTTTKCCVPVVSRVCDRCWTHIPTTRNPLDPPTSHCPRRGKRC